MSAAELIEKAKKEGYNFCYLGEMVLILSKTCNRVVGQDYGFYACCKTDSLMIWHFIGHGLAMRYRVEWEDET